MDRAKGRLLELEERIPWCAVKKKWTPKRQSWVNSVQHATSFPALTKRLCMLETALKQESLDGNWGARRDEWRARLTERAPGSEAEGILEAVAGLEAGISWDRVREDVRQLELQMEIFPSHPQLVNDRIAGGDGGGGGGSGGGVQAIGNGKRSALVPVSVRDADDLFAQPPSHNPSPRIPHRAGAGLGKRPRASLSPGGSTPRVGGSIVAAGLKRRSNLTELCARGEANWDEVLTEATVPTRDQLLSGPMTERVPISSLRMLALLEGAGVGGRHEGAVVTQLLELIHRHVSSVLADAVECCAHRLDTPDAATAAAEVGQLDPRDVRMAVEMELVALAQATPPPREVLVNSGCCAINMMPLPLLPDAGPGVVLPSRTERLASLRM
mmetsp:Transcript_10300/g.24706  ORF Transcript_10300/g.24706 Transcript_10300/m.24706 type:complete len:384 (-) Transcript_10300:88-1239(-)